MAIKSWIIELVTIEEDPTHSDQDAGQSKTKKKKMLVRVG